MPLSGGFTPLKAAVTFLAAGAAMCEADSTAVVAQREAEQRASFTCGACGHRWLRFRMQDEPTLKGIACLRLRLHEAFAHYCRRGSRDFPQRLQHAVHAAAVIFSQEGVTSEDGAAAPSVRGRCAPPPALLPVVITAVDCSNSQSGDTCVHTAVQVAPHWRAPRSGSALAGAPPLTVACGRRSVAR